MKPKRRPGTVPLPVGALMALVLLVIAVVLVFGAFQQQSVNERKSVDVLNRDKALDQREAELDQRRSALNQRDDAIAKQESSLSDRQQALEKQKGDLDEDDAALKAREQTLAEGVQALAKDQAALTQAQIDLAAREKALVGKQADYDTRLQDYVSLQQAVDDALGARSRIASTLTAAFKAAGTSAVVDEEGGASVELSMLFDGSSAALTKDGKLLLDAMLPVWYQALSGETYAALSVEVTAPEGDSQALDLAARRAMAILEYAEDAQALGEDGRRAILCTGLSGARPDATGASRAVFRFFLNNDALRVARAG